MSIADHGLPISVVADDSAFPELFEHLRKEREQWSVTLITWRNLREHLRRAAQARRCSGSSSTGATAPTASRFACSARGRRCRPVRPRSPPRRTRGSSPSASGAGATAGSTSSWSDPIVVASTDPAELQRATQAMADELDRDRGRRAGAVVQLQADVAGDPPRRRPTSSAAPSSCRPAAPTRVPSADDRRPTEAPPRDGRPGGARATGRRAGVDRGPPAGGSVDPPRGAGRLGLVPGSARSGGPGAAQPASRRAGPRRTRPGITPRFVPPPTTPQRSSASSGRPSATTPGTTSRWRARRRFGARDIDVRLLVETPDVGRRRVPQRRAGRSSSASTSAISSCRHGSSRERVGAGRRADGDDRRSGPAGVLRADARGERRAASSACARHARRAARRPHGRGVRRPRR